MEQGTYVYFLTVILILIWNTVLYATVDEKQYYVNFFTSTCYLMQQELLPQFAVLRRHMVTPFSSTVKQVTLPQCSEYQSFGAWQMTHRPIVGDHIHLQMVLSVNNHVYNFHDRNMSQRIPYEVDNYPVTCPNPGTYAYEKRWYHTGVHTHCDGNIVHVHPWSAPNQLRVEGRDVKLKLWFESVGIEVATNMSALKLPGDTHYISDWNMEYYIHANDETPAFTTVDVEAMANLWLVDNHGEILLWSGGQRPQKQYQVLAYECHPSDYPTRNRMRV